MKRADVQRAFEAYLLERGWDLHAEPGDHAGIAGIEAHRGAQRLIGEVRGTASSPGPDVDTGYGRLLRRMSSAHEDATYALIAAVGLTRLMERVEVAVRRGLGIGLFVVDDLGRVHRVRTDQDASEAMVGWTCSMS